MADAIKSTFEDNSLEKSQKVVRVVYRILDGWDLTADQAQTLMGVSQATWTAWRSGDIRESLDAATSERVSCILRIHAALNTLIPVPARAQAWVTRVNSGPLFGSRTPLSRMLGGQVGDLMVVADYLDAQQGCDFS